MKDGKKKMTPPRLKLVSNNESVERDADFEDPLAAEAREHILVWAAPWHGEYRSVQSAVCETCGAGVSISTRPLPNEIDIGGSAVAVNCDC